MTTNTSESFVYENVEVIKTGRCANKTLPSGKKDTLFEITPKHSTSGSWKKWVRQTELFEITGTSK